MLKQKVYKVRLGLTFDGKFVGVKIIDIAQVVQAAEAQDHLRDGPGRDPLAALAAVQSA